MRFALLAVVVAAATAGASIGYYHVSDYVSRDDSRVPATTGARTVTVMQTVTETLVRTIVRPDARAGRRVFLTACSRCHTLEPGDWTGDRVNLTDLRPSYRVTFETATGGGTGMPSFDGKLSERQIRDVAAFVTAETARRAGKTP
jgi:mono/diheme cytochrome c family protein